MDLRTHSGSVFSLLRNTAAVNALNLAFGLVSGVLVARELGPEGRGLLAGLFVWSVTIADLALLGIGESVIYAARGDERAALILRRATSKSTLWQSFAALLVLAPILLILAEDDNNKVLLVLLLAGFLCSFVYIDRAMSVLRAAGRFNWWNYTRLLPSAGYSVSISALSAVGQLHVLSCITAFAVTSACTGLVSCLLLRRLPKPANLHAPDRVMVGGLRSYGRSITLAMLPHQANARVDQMLLALFAADAALGLYVVAVSLTALSQVLATTLEQVLFPHLSRQGEPIRWLQARRLLRLGLLAGGVLAVASAAVAERAVELVYGSAFSAAVSPAYILLSGGPAVVATSVLTAVAKAANQVRAVFLGQLVGLAATAVLLGMLLPIHGINGAAAASATAYWLTLIGITYRLRGQLAH